MLPKRTVYNASIRVMIDPVIQGKFAFNLKKYPKGEEPRTKIRMLRAAIKYEGSELTSQVNNKENYEFMKESKAKGHR